MEKVLRAQFLIWCLEKNIFDDDGTTKFSKGYNLIGLGISRTRYFEPLKLNSWNNYWHYGTLLFIIPYIGIGTEYIWKNGFYFGFKSIYIIPQLDFGWRFK
jgi:hypothetical protein